MEPLSVGDLVIWYRKGTSSVRIVETRDGEWILLNGVEGNIFNRSTGLHNTKDWFVKRVSMNEAIAEIKSRPEAINVPDITIKEQLQKRIEEIFLKNETRIKTTR